MKTLEQLIVEYYLAPGFGAGAVTSGSSPLPVGVQPHQKKLSHARGGLPAAAQPQEQESPKPSAAPDTEKAEDFALKSPDKSKRYNDRVKITKEFAKQGEDSKKKAIEDKENYENKWKRQFRKVPDVIKEETPTNVVGTGLIAGTTPDTVAGPKNVVARTRRKISGCEVFAVDSKKYQKCVALGKGKYAAYSEYFDPNSELGQQINESAELHGGAVVIQDQDTKMVLVLRIKKMPT